MGKGLNSFFSKKDIEMVNSHIKRCSVSLVIRETQVQTTVNYHITTVRMIKK